MIEVRCISCSRVIMGYPEGDKLPTEKEVIACQHCGTDNRVRPIPEEVEVELEYMKSKPKIAPKFVPNRKQKGR
jgi:DNA-directed RNA polymerase subunit RPC12/RpoP